MVDLVNFPKAVPEPRGCGDREPGGVYAECGLSENGAPLDFFAFCPESFSKLFFNQED